MAPSPRRFELEDAVTRPGTYFNPATEMLLVVDDGAAVDSDVVDGDETDWFLVSENAPVDDTVRDELVERFATRYGSGPTGAVAASEDDEDEVDDLDDLGDIEHEEGADDGDPYAGTGFDEADAEEEDDDY